MMTALLIGLGAAAQGITGMGFGLLCAPVLIESFGAAEGVRQVVLLSLLLNLLFLSREFRLVRPVSALGLLLPALVVTPFLKTVLKQADPRLLLLVAGSLTVGSAGFLAFGLRLPWLRGAVGAGVAGVVSAAMNVAGGLAGPAVALYAVNTSWPPQAVRTTLQCYGALLNTVTLLSLGFPTLHASQLGALVIGSCVGLLTVNRMPRTIAQRVVLALAGAGGVLVMVRALT